MAKIIFTIPSVLNQGGGEKKSEIFADSLQESFAKISELMGDDFKRKVLESDGSPRSLINIYINGKNAAFDSGLDTVLNENDEVYILPAVAGGSELSEKELDQYSRQVMLEQIGYQGQLKLKNDISTNYEVTPALNVVITATDSTGLSYSQALEVIINNVNEEPTDIKLSATSFNENVNGIIIGTVTTIDEDVGDTYTYSLSGDNSDLFEIVNGQLKLKEGISADYETKTTYSLTITSTDAGGLSFTKEFTLTVNNVNEPVTYIKLGTSNYASVNEGLKGAFVGSLEIDDPDLGEERTYLITGQDAKYFEVVNGNLRVKSGVELDYEALSFNSYDEDGNPIAKTVSVRYTAPGGTSNGMPGTSPDAAGAFARTNTAFYVDGEYDMGDLLVQAAFRMEDFSDFGNTSNFKVVGRYSLGNLATLRGGYSTGFRAPTPGQSNYTGTVTSFDGVTGMQIQEGTLKPTHPLSVSMGGAALGPEDAVNLSAGFTTSMISGLNLSVDYYQIDVTNKIIKSRSLAVPEGSGYDFAELAFYTNALDTKTSGIDVVADYTMGNTNIGLAVNSNTTEVVRQREINGENPVSDGNVQNIEENLPGLRVAATASHQLSDALSLMARVNHYGETTDERGDKEIVAAIQLVDIELNYRVSDNLSVVFGANNALNTFPTQIKTRMSQGMPYPRRTPIGYHGGMMFTRLTYNF